ncbi:MAG: hypothetical protein ACTTJS_02725 [Wolinella sp.]
MLAKNLVLFFAILLLQYPLNADSRVFYAKLEPIETYEIKAATSGQVLSAKKELEGKFIRDNSLIVQLDDRLDRELLALDKNALKNLRAREESQREIASIKDETAQNIESLKTKSRIQKESERINALNARISHLQTLEQIDSLRSSIATRADTIEKKSISVENRYIYKINVNVGEYVTAGTSIASVMDVSSAKVVFFISKDEAENISKKSIYINGKKSDAKISKLYKVADSEHISEYRIEAILPSVGIFSQLIKIELKD